jgi:hypothetical protein
VGSYAGGLSNYARQWRIRAEAPSGQTLLDLRCAHDAVGTVTAGRGVQRSVSSPFLFSE